MTVLDTNVLSELMRPSPDSQVVQWVDDQPGPSLFTTAVTQAEILYGVAILQVGRRKLALQAAARDLFAQEFAVRVLPFDGEAAAAYAEICAERRQQGQPVSQLDAQIAAITRSRGGALATRNTADFEGCGIRVIDPWAGSA